MIVRVLHGIVAILNGIAIFISPLGALGLLCHASIFVCMVLQQVSWGEL